MKEKFAIGFVDIAGESQQKYYYGIANLVEKEIEPYFLKINNPYIDVVTIRYFTDKDKMLLDIKDIQEFSIGDNVRFIRLGREEVA